MKKVVANYRITQYNNYEVGNNNYITAWGGERMLYDYLRETYGENEPIFVSDIRYKDCSMNYIRQQIKRLTDSGELKRYDTGIYFIPGRSIFKSGPQLSRDKVIEQKYLKADGSRCGYISGVLFANQLGLSTQVPMVCEAVTNKATSEYREVKLASSTVILRKPRVNVTEDNYRSLQLLDFIKDADYYVEVGGETLKARMSAYMKANGIRFKDLERFFAKYPDKIYKNMFEMGLLNGIPS